MERRWDIAVLVGSLRRDSYNRLVAKALSELVPPSLRLTTVEIAGLSLYNEDKDSANPPSEWTSFRERIARADAILFVTPEYNRSIPGGLKNAIDIGSRPYAQSVWRGKPAAVISVSTGALGGFGAAHHLRQTFVFLDLLPMQQPEAYIGHAAKLFNSEGKLVEATVREHLSRFAEAFVAWIELLHRK